jgi:hypothetical protein
VVLLGAAGADVVKVAAARACTSNSCMQRSAGMFERSRVPGSNVKDRVWRHGCAVFAASAYVQLVQMMLGLNQFFADIFMLHGLSLAWGVFALNAHQCSRLLYFLQEMQVIQEEVRQAHNVEMQPFTAAALVRMTEAANEQACWLLCATWYVCCTTWNRQL